MAKETKTASADKTAEANDNKALLEAKDATIAELTEELAKKNSEMTLLTEIVAGKDEAIATLTEQLEAAKGTPTVNDRPSYKGYQFLVDAFKFKGNKHTAEEAVKNPDLMKELIDSKFPSLKKVK